RAHRDRGGKDEEREEGAGEDALGVARGQPRRGDRAVRFHRRHHRRQPRRHRQPRHRRHRHDRRGDAHHDLRRDLARVKPARPLSVLVYHPDRDEADRYAALIPAPRGRFDLHVCATAEEALRVAPEVSVIYGWRVPPALYEKAAKLTWLQA